MTHGQYAVGIAGGSWEGIWGLGHQPASILLNRDRMEFGLVRASVDAYKSFEVLDGQGVGFWGFNDRIIANKKVTHEKDS